MYGAGEAHGNNRAAHLTSGRIRERRNLNDTLLGCLQIQRRAVVFIAGEGEWLSVDLQAGRGKLVGQVFCGLSLG